MKIRFLEPAQRELDDAYQWYEAEQQHLGRHFLKEVHYALRRIDRYPESCSVIAPGLRRCATKRFPYMLIYGIDEGTILIIAVAHMHREPMYWQKK
jgi:plasmid stabilization system protein ParE